MSRISFKTSLRRFLRSRGWELQRLQHANIEWQILKDILRHTGTKTVLDVGANIGQYGDLLFDTGFDGTLISFEALPDAHRQLSEHSKVHPRWLVAPCAALGSARGQVEMNVSANSVSSSVLPMRQTHLQAAPQSLYVSKQTVDVERLDDLAPRLLQSEAALMIKVDTQGYELEVIKGATALLPRTTAFQLELSLIPLYEGAPTFLDMTALMESIGFDLFGIVPGFRDASTGRLLQVDGFFVRADTPAQRLTEVLDRPRLPTR